MISAGNNMDPRMQGMQGMQGYGAPQPQAGAVQLSTPAQLPYTPISAPNLNISIPKLSEGMAAKYLGWQTLIQAGGAVGNIITSFLNYGIAKTAMEKQAEVAGKYYDTQDKLAGYQKDVAIRQLDVQESGFYVQRDMHSAQVRHEENMARLEGHTRARLARIGEDGRTERARILSVTDAFSRRGWDMGTPLAA